MNTAFKYLTSLLNVQTKYRDKESEDTFSSKRQKTSVDLGTDDDGEPLLFKSSPAQKAAKKQTKASAPASSLFQKEANMPRKRKHEDSKVMSRIKRKRTSVDSLLFKNQSPTVSKKQMESPVAASPPVQREAKKKVEDANPVLADETQEIKEQSREDTLECTSSVLATNGIGSKARDSLEMYDIFPPPSPIKPLNLCRAVLSLSTIASEMEATKEAETDHDVHAAEPSDGIKVKASESIEYFNKCFNMIPLHQLGFPFPANEASDEMENSISAVIEEENDNEANEDTETNFAPAAANVNGSNVFDIRPFPSNEESEEESEEEEERPFDAFSLNNNLSSGDESSESSGEDEDDGKISARGHVIFLPSDEEDEDKDDDLSNSSEEEEWNDTTSVEPELDTRVANRIRRKNWIDGQIKLLLIAIKESRRRDTRTGQINWKAVEKHRCIEQLKKERPTDTIEHFMQKYRNLLKQDQKKYNDVMATL